MSSPMREELPRGSGPISIGLGRRLAAQATWAFHVAVVGYILFGWALPWSAAWWVYAVGAPFVQLGWIVFNDYCWLSIIEAKLRGDLLDLFKDLPAIGDFNTGKHWQLWMGLFIVALIVLAPRARASIWWPRQIPNVGMFASRSA